MNEHFAEIFPLEHADESGWRLCKAVGDVLAVTNVSVGDSGGNILQECGVMLRRELVIDEAAQGQALAQDLTHRRRQKVRSGEIARRIILSNQSADRTAGKRIEKGKPPLPYRAAHVLEIDIDSLGTRRLQLFGKIR